MKSRFMKGVVMAIAAISTVAAMSATAMAAVTLSHPSDTQVTATTTASGLDRLVLAEFDPYGRMRYLTVGGDGVTSVTNTFTQDAMYVTKIMQFSNFDSATALEDVRKLGSNTLFYYKGYKNESSAGGTLDPYNAMSDDEGLQVFTKSATSTAITAKNDGSIDLGNTCWIHFPAGSLSTDWTVFEWDMTINSNMASEKDDNAEGFSIRLNNGSKEVINGVEGHLLELVKVTYDDEGTYTPGIWWNHKPYTKISYMGGSTSTISAGTTISFKVLVNQKDRKVSMYVGDTLYETTVATGFDLAAVRVAFTGKYDVTFDNIKVYEGAKVRSNVSTEALRFIGVNPSNSLYNVSHPGRYDDANYTEQIGTNKAIHATTGVVWNGTDKVLLENLPYRNDSGVMMVPLEELESVLGMTAGTTDGSVDVDGVTYVPITSFVQGKTYTKLNASNNANCYVFASGFAPSDVDDFNDWMLYYRPSAEELLSLYSKSGVSNEHPRLLATDADFDYLAEIFDAYNMTSTPDVAGDLERDDNQVRWIRWAINHANSRITKKANGDKTTTPVYEPYDTEGRMNYQRYLASDVYAFGMAYQMAKRVDKSIHTWDTIQDPQVYVDYIYENLLAICNFTDWNLSHKLDVSEAMAAAAIGYDWFYDAFTEEQRNTLKKGFCNNGLFFAWQGYDTLSSAMGQEILMSNNHGTVANTGALMLALAMMDEYPTECAYIASQALKGAELTLYKWQTGMWYEGANYWELEMQFTAKFLGCLDSVFPTDFGFSNLEGLDKAGEAQVQIHGATDIIFNYGDANENTFFVPELIWLANKYDQPGLAYIVNQKSNGGFALNGDQTEGEDRALAGLWYDVDNASAESLSLNYFNDELDIVTAREAWNDTEASFFGAKGGNDPTDGHSHLDAGSFVFEADGVRWAKDLGMGSYISSYFETGDTETVTGQITGDRWKFISARAEAHNTLSINPTTTQGDQYRAEAPMTVKANDSGVIATVDLSDVLFGVSSAKRGFWFTDNRQSLVIRDELTTNASDSIYWTMVLPTGVTSETNGNTITLTASTGEKLTLEYEVTGNTANDVSISTTGFAPIDSTNIKDSTKFSTMAEKLQMKITAASGSNVTITVKLTPGSVTSPSALSNYTGGIANWSL